MALGPQTLATPLIPPVTRPLEDLEPMTAGALRRFLDAYSVVPDLPVALSMRGFARVFLRNETIRREQPDGGDAAALTRAVLTQLSVFHAPDELLIAICAGPERRARWEWVKWLPHAQHPTSIDALGPVRLVTSAAVELEQLLDDVVGNRSRFSPAGPATDGPHVVIVLDGGDLTGAAYLAGDSGIDAVTIIDLGSPPPRLLDRSMLVLEVGDGRLNTLSMDGEAEVGTPDRLDVVEAEAVARRLAPLRLAAASKGSDAPLAAEMGLAELLGVGDPDNFSAGAGLGAPAATGTGCGCRSGWAPTAARSNWTSRSPRRTAWARTAC